MEGKKKMEINEEIRGFSSFGLIQLFEGHGKGKTTAGLGEALRAVGAGKRVCIVFFDKGGERYSERRAILKYLSEVIVFYGTGRNRIDSAGRFDFSITDDDKAEGERGLGLVLEAFEGGEFDFVVLDEINSSANLGVVDEQRVLDVLDKKPRNIEVLLTGRDAPQSFKDRADLITEMRLKKHYFYSGVKSREGLDF